MSRYLVYVEDKFGILINNSSVVDGSLKDAIGLAKDLATSGQLVSGCTVHVAEQIFSCNSDGDVLLDSKVIG